MRSFLPFVGFVAFAFAINAIGAGLIAGTLLLMQKLPFEPSPFITYPAVGVAVGLTVWVAKKMVDVISYLVARLAKNRAHGQG